MRACACLPRLTVLGEAVHRHGAKGSPGVRHQAEEGGEDEGDPRAGSSSPGLNLIKQVLGPLLKVTVLANNN